MNRKEKLRAALGARVLPDGNEPVGEGTTLEGDVLPSGDLDAARVRPLVRSGAVGAMGRSLGRITHAVEEARAMVAAGDKVVELEPSLIESSFVADRLESSDEDHAALVASIRERGQQVPILVRPHPDHPGRYQVAYGHRRLRAAADLKQPVRAVVKALSDEDLVVAQGQENSARTDLSFIERALFAIALEDRGFDRSVIMAALSIEKTQLSKLIGIGREVPGSIIAAVGPAPKAGRPRWAALVSALARANAPAIIERTLKSTEFRVLDSDSRFSHLLAALTAPLRPDRATVSTVWKNPSGRAVVQIERTARRTQLTVHEAAEPEFASFLIENLPDLFERFSANKSAQAQELPD
jgi:ParB family chromosome partitioning protein